MPPPCPDNPEAGELRIVATYGLDTGSVRWMAQSSPPEGTMGRVVRTGQLVSIADVLLDPEAERFSTRTQSMLAVPVRRRNRVTAVLCLESPRKNGFSPEHLDFAQQIANRASIALDNARLFLETQQERQKLSSILEKTTDIVIVVGFDQRLILLNDAALAAFRLKPQDAIPGTPFLQLFAYTPLEKVARNLELEDWHPVVEDIVLDGTRYFHANIVPNEQVGWVILMHDITPFKETEQLKNELIATVSHDLKNPLSVINGYIELLGMYGTLDEREQEFMLMIRRSIRTMRQLIDDLLDLAHIDTGLDLHLEPINIYPIIEDSVVGQKNLAEEKKQSVLIDTPQDLPLVAGDKRRLARFWSTWSATRSSTPHRRPDRGVGAIAQGRDHDLDRRQRPGDWPGGSDPDFRALLPGPAAGDRFDRRHRPGTGDRQESGGSPRRHHWAELATWAKARPSSSRSPWPRRLQPHRNVAQPAEEAG
jgi:signal transduction histidine kinase